MICTAWLFREWLVSRLSKACYSILDAPAAINIWRKAFSRKPAVPVFSAETFDDKPSDIWTPGARNTTNSCRIQHWQTRLVGLDYPSVSGACNRMQQFRLQKTSICLLYRHGS